MVAVSERGQTRPPNPLPTLRRSAADGRTGGLPRSAIGARRRRCREEDSEEHREGGVDRGDLVPAPGDAAHHRHGQGAAAGRARDAAGRPSRLFPPHVQRPPVASKKVPFFFPTTSNHC